ncbi:MAG TPA: hypothetical protein ENG40_00885 [Thermoprotei archaeon]|nr:hypothetical protein [Thermoprotei archaeon]
MIFFKSRTCYKDPERMKSYYCEYEHWLALTQMQKCLEDKMKLEIGIKEFTIELTGVCREVKIYIISSL